jgi:hypothetical protein
LTDYGGDEKDWRLQATLAAPAVGTSPGTVLERFNGRHGLDELRAGVPHDVVVTHDGDRLFAYAASESLLASARQAIEQTLSQAGESVSVRVSHWDDDLDDWLQTDPPADAQQQSHQDAVRRDADAIETRTVVASAGRIIRAEFEQSLGEWAKRLGVECEVIEHRHLLKTQVAFTVTGPKRKVTEFVQGVTAEELTSIRIERTALLSPL